MTSDARPTDDALDLVLRRAGRLSRGLRDRAGAKELPRAVAGGRGATLTRRIEAARGTLPAGVVAKLELIDETRRRALDEGVGGAFNAAAFEAACDEVEAALVEEKRRELRAVLFDRTVWIGFGATFLFIAAGIVIIAWLMLTHEPG